MELTPKHVLIYTKRKKKCVCVLVFQGVFFVCVCVYATQSKSLKRTVFISLVLKNTKIAFYSLDIIKNKITEVI